MANAAAEAEILVVGHRFHEDVEIVALKHAEEAGPGLAAGAAFEVDRRADDQGDDVMQGNRVATPLQEIERGGSALVDDFGAVEQQLAYQRVLALEVIADGADVALTRRGEDIAN